MTTTSEATPTGDQVDVVVDRILRKAGVDPVRDRWLRKSTMATALDTTIRTIERRVDAGLLRPFIDGNRVLFSVDEARRYLKAGFVQGDEAA